MKLALQAMSLIGQERDRQDKKWGEQNHEPFTWNTILMEEIGEFSQEALRIRFSPEHRNNEITHRRMLNECVQVAAVATAMVECLLRNTWQWPGEEKPKDE